MALGLGEGEVVGIFVCWALAPEDRSLNPLNLTDELPDTGCGMSSIVLNIVTRPLVAAPFREMLEVTGAFAIRFRASVADTVDASDVVFDELEAFKDAKSSGDP